VNDQNANPNSETEETVEEEAFRYLYSIFKDKDPKLIRLDLDSKLSDLGTWVDQSEKIDRFWFFIVTQDYIGHQFLGEFFGETIEEFYCTKESLAKKLDNALKQEDLNKTKEKISEWLKQEFGEKLGNKFNEEYFKEEELKKRKDENKDFLKWSGRIVDNILSEFVKFLKMGFDRILDEQYFKKQKDENKDFLKWSKRTKEEISEWLKQEFGEKRGNMLDGKYFDEDGNFSEKTEEQGDQNQLIPLEWERVEEKMRLKEKIYSVKPGSCQELQINDALIEKLKELKIECHKGDLEENHLLRYFASILQKNPSLESLLVQSDDNKDAA